MLGFQARRAAVGEEALLCRHLPLDVSRPLALGTEGAKRDNPCQQKGELQSWALILLVSRPGLV